MSVPQPIRVLSALVAVLFPASAAATYSIVAVDQSSGQVGGAGTSCVGGFSVSVIYGAAPGQGAVHAQAFYNEQGRNLAVSLLGQGVDAPDIIQQITAPAFDRQVQRRQYAVVDLRGGVSAFTGSETGPWAGDRTGQIGSFVYSAQGNILTGPQVVTQAADAFEGGGCDLADRLMNALLAGAQGGIGDSRCTPDGIPSDGAYLRIDPLPPQDAVFLRVDDTSPQDPLQLLNQQYQAWRVQNPCPAPMDAGSGPDLGAPDLSPAPDSGLLSDQGAAPDSGPQIDVGFPFDGGAPIDAGDRLDQGSADEPDAQTASDLGSTRKIGSTCTCLTKSRTNRSAEAIGLLSLAALYRLRRLRRRRRRSRSSARS